MTYDNTSNSDNQTNQENIFGTPEDREEEDHRLHRLRGTMILSKSEVKNLGGWLPGIRVGTYLVNGTPVEKTEDMRKIGAHGQIDSLDDVVGFSWLKNEPIPRGWEAYCSDPYDCHMPRLFYHGIDGLKTEGGALCSECLDQKKRRFWLDVGTGISIVTAIFILIWLKY